MALAAGVSWLGIGWSDPGASDIVPPAAADVAAAGAPADPGVRLAGTVEAARAFAVSVPRLTGPSSGTALVITRLVPGGSRVETGDVLVEFDRQEQERAARDRRSEHLDLEGQIRTLRAEQAAARAADEAELTVARNDVERARLDVRTNPLLPRIEAEKNDLALEEALARVAQLTETLALKRTAAGAERRILEIQRDRARRDAEHAERNAEVMTVRAPFGGLVVLKTLYRGPGRFAEVQESEEVRPGVAILDLVDVSAMQVRARVNQADIAAVAAGRPVRIGLDAYPDLAFAGRVEQVAPLAVPSQLAPRVRTFTALISIHGTHERLMPDLSAAVDIDLPSPPVAPRDAQAPAGTP